MTALPEWAIQMKKESGDCATTDLALEALAIAWDALNATDIYFKALCEQWAAHDGRVVSKSGMVIDASADCERLCEIAATKTGEAIMQIQAMDKEA